VGRPLDVAILNLVPRRVGQHVERKACFQQRVSLCPVDHRLEVDPRRVGVEHHVLRQRRLRADLVLAADADLERAVGDDLSAHEAILDGELEAVVVVNIPVIPPGRDVLAHEQRVERAAPPHDLAARRLVDERDDAARAVEAHRRVRRVEAPVFHGEGRVAAGLALRKLDGGGPQRGHGRPADDEHAVALDILDPLGADARVGGARALGGIGDDDLAGAIPAQGVEPTSAPSASSPSPRASAMQESKDSMASSLTSAMDEPGRMSWNWLVSSSFHRARSSAAG